MNSTLFATKTGRAKPANTTNAAGGVAYAMGDEESLAQYVVTACFGNTYYVSGQEQVDKILTLSRKCSAEFVAKAAIYGHCEGKMKDAPAVLLAVLLDRAKSEPLAGLYFDMAFPKVISNVKMLMNFVQVIRSGKVGRKSFGSRGKRAIRTWLEGRNPNQLFTGAIGGNPSFADIVKMVHPKPSTPERAAFYAYMIGKPYGDSLASLPTKVHSYEEFKQAKLAGREGPAVPDVPFMMLGPLGLNTEQWCEVARNMPWNALRMNLNTLARHGVFDKPGMEKLVADKLADAEAIRKSKTFPYTVFSAYKHAEGVPTRVLNALQDAAEIATENIPAFDDHLAICIDTSGSMQSPITGSRGSATSKMRYIDAAAVFGVSMLRKNSSAILLPFDTRVHDPASINPRDSIMTNAEKLARFGGGGTDCASALRVLNGLVGHKRPKLIVYVSDNASWFNGRTYYSYSPGMAQEWEAYRRKTPGAKLVCIDIATTTDTQVQDSPNTLNIGGWSDTVFSAVERFAKHGNTNFSGVVNAVEI